MLERERMIFGSVFNSPENIHALENTDVIKRHSSYSVCNKHTTSSEGNEQYQELNEY